MPSTPRPGHTRCKSSLHTRGPVSRRVLLRKRRGASWVCSMPGPAHAYCTGSTPRTGPSLERKERLKIVTGEPESTRKRQFSPCSFCRCRQRTRSVPRPRSKYVSGGRPGCSGSAGIGGGMLAHEARRWRPARAARRRGKSGTLFMRDARKRRADAGCEAQDAGRLRPRHQDTGKNIPRRTRHLFFSCFPAFQIPTLPLCALQRRVLTCGRSDPFCS